MTVILFAPRFAPLVESGAKCQTIRAPRKRPVRVGDVLSLRAWTGAPYRSPQRVLREAVCSAVSPLWMDDHGPDDSGLAVEVAGVRLGRSDVAAFAQADGFEAMDVMFEWWRQNRYFPFEGTLIEWRVRTC